MITLEQLKERKIQNINGSKKCIICLKNLTNNKIYYCSGSCADSYNYIVHSKKYKENAKKWCIENPKKAKEMHLKAFNKFRKIKHERFNYLMRSSYKKNKDKWYSRNMTNKYLKDTKLSILLKNECKICLSKEKIEIHHEIYPTSKKEIEEAIKNNKIYYLCKKCHEDAHKAKEGSQ